MAVIHTAPHGGQCETLLVLLARQSPILWTFEDLDVCEPDSHDGEKQGKKELQHQESCLETFGDLLVRRRLELLCFLEHHFLGFRF